MFKDLMDLKELDAQGWILGPEETKDDLLLRKKVVEKKGEGFTLKKAHDLTYALYKFRAKDVPVFRSKDSIRPWQGALFWEYFAEDGLSYPVIQLRARYGKWLQVLYPLSEILAHELVHAARFSFHQPFFEEIFAYKTSKNFFRRFMGPLFMFPWEASLFVYGGLLAMGAFVFMDGLWGVMIFGVFCFYLFFRLIGLHTLLHLAKTRLEKIGIKESLAVLFRLPDRLIIKIAFNHNWQNDRLLKDVLAILF